MVESLVFRKKSLSCGLPRKKATKKTSFFKLLMPLVALSLPVYAGKKTNHVKASEMQRVYKVSRTVSLGAIERRKNGYLYSLVMPTSDKRRLVVGMFKSKNTLNGKKKMFLIMESEHRTIEFLKKFHLSDLELAYRKKTGREINKATVLCERKGERYVFYLIPHDSVTVTIKLGSPLEKFHYNRKKRKAYSEGVKFVSSP